MSPHLTAMVALLRGVNVGGARSLPMGLLRELATATGLEQVQSYIQSGNLVFAAPEGSEAAVAQTLRTEIERETAHDVEVIVRTGSQLAATVEASPFLTGAHDPANLHVVFMAEPTAPLVKAIDMTRFEPEELAARGDELHLYLPLGAGRSKLVTELGRHTGPHGTMRNWRTVTKLLAMADATST